MRAPLPPGGRGPATSGRRNRWRTKNVSHATHGNMRSAGIDRPANLHPPRVDVNDHLYTCSVREPGNGYRMLYTSEDIVSKGLDGARTEAVVASHSHGLTGVFTRLAVERASSWCSCPSIKGWSACVPRVPLQRCQPRRAHTRSGRLSERGKLWRRLLLCHQSVEGFRGRLLAEVATNNAEVVFDFISHSTIAIGIPQHRT